MLTNPVIAKINQEQLLIDNPDFKREEFKVGDTVAVVVRVIEGGKERKQTFQGVVIAINNRGVHSSFIVRKISHGIGVERTFMLHSRSIQEIRVVRPGLVRQAKIYYMRERSGKAARIAKRFDNKPGTKTLKAEKELAGFDKAQVAISAAEQADAVLAEETTAETEGGAKTTATQEATPAAISPTEEATTATEAAATTETSAPEQPGKTSAKQATTDKESPATSDETKAQEDVTSATEKADNQEPKS